MSTDTDGGDFYTREKERESASGTVSPYIQTQSYETAALQSGQTKNNSS